MPGQTRTKRGRSIETISERRRTKLERVIRQRQRDLTIVLENVWDPHNVSACLRSADAVGIQDVHFLYYIEAAPDMRRLGKQSSASAKKWLTIHRHSGVSACFEGLRDEGYTILASHLTPGASSLYEMDARKKLALVFGNEHRGVSDEACRMADGVFYIPMMGMVQSLNISVAVAVTLYEACRQRIASGAYGAATQGSGTDVDEDVRRQLETWAAM